MEIIATTDERLLASLCFATLANKPLLVHFPQGMNSQQKDLLESYTCHGTFSGVGIGSEVCTFTPIQKRKTILTGKYVLAFPQYFVLPCLLTQQQITLSYEGPTITSPFGQLTANISFFSTVFKTFIDVKSMHVEHSWDVGSLQAQLVSRLTSCKQLRFSSGAPHGFRVFADAQAKQQEILDELVAYVQLGLAQQSVVTITKSTCKEPGLGIHLLSKYGEDEQCLPLVQLQGIATLTILPEKKELEPELDLMLTISRGSRTGFDEYGAMQLLPALCVLGGSMPIETYTPKIQELVELAELLLGIAVVYEGDALHTKGLAHEAEELVFLGN